MRKLQISRIFNSGHGIIEMPLIKAKKGEFTGFPMRYHVIPYGSIKRVKIPPGYYFANLDPNHLEIEHLGLGGLPQLIQAHDFLQNGKKHYEMSSKHSYFAVQKE